jgi:hypothetical protein
MTSDPTAIIEALDPEQIRDQLDELERHRAALRQLLRVAEARERATLRRQLTVAPQEVHRGQ